MELSRELPGESGARDKDDDDDGDGGSDEESVELKQSNEGKLPRYLTAHLV